MRILFEALAVYAAICCVIGLVILIVSDRRLPWPSRGAPPPAEDPPPRVPPGRERYYCLLCHHCRPTPLGTLCAVGDPRTGQGPLLVSAEQKNRNFDCPDYLPLLPSTIYPLRGRCPPTVYRL